MELSKSERFRRILKHLKLNQSGFAEKFSFARSMVSGWYNDDKLPAGESFVKILQIEPDINVIYWLSGSGEPLFSLQKNQVMPKYDESQYLQLLGQKAMELAEKEDKIEELLKAMDTIINYLKEITPAEELERIEKEWDQVKDKI